MAIARVMRWAVVLLVVGALAGAAVWVFPGDSESGELVTLGDGVTPLVIDDIGLIAVRNGEDVTVFRGFDRRGEPLEWCAVSNVLTTNTGGSVYDLAGEKLGGPAPSGLDRVSVIPEGGDAFRVDPARLLDPILLTGDTAADLPALASSVVTEGWLDRFRGQASYCPSLEDIG